METKLFFIKYILRYKEVVYIRTYINFSNSLLKIGSVEIGR